LWWSTKYGSFYTNGKFTKIPLLVFLIAEETLWSQATGQPQVAAADDFIQLVSIWI